MPTADEAVATFASLLGIKENPPKSNRTPIGEEFGWNGVAWCAITYSVVMNRIGFGWFHTASVAQIEAWAKAGFNGLTWHPASETPQRGDAVVYDLKGNGLWQNFHTGMVDQVFPGRQGFRTYEGNWADAVVHLDRFTYSNVRGFARPPYSTPAAPVVPPVNIPISKGTHQMASAQLGKDGRIVEVRPAMGNVIIRWQQKANEVFVKWAPTYGLPPFPLSDVALVQNADGRWEIRGWNGSRYATQVQKQDGSWNAWVED